MLTFNRQDFKPIIQTLVPKESQDYFYDILTQENKKSFKDHSIATLSRFTNIVPSYQENKPLLISVVSVWKKIWKLSYGLIESYVSDVSVPSLKSLVGNIATVISNILGLHVEIASQVSILVSAYLLKFHMPKVHEPMAA